MKFLLLNQTFYPDVASTAQHLSDLALELVKRGHQVTVLTSRRAYDDPAKLFPKQETWRGIRIVRIGSTGFGKAAKWRRAADFGSFLALCCLRLAVLPRHDAVVALTSPPLISFLGAWLAKLRGSRFFYWVMDFNPDEAIAAGWLRPNSLAARLLDGMSRFSLKRATKIIALDRFMRERILAKGIASEKVVVLPPWSHDNAVRFDAAGRERFRKAHGLEGKFVVMYSGNHSPCHPLDTLVEAARRLAEDREVVFCFVGGGSEWRKIKEMQSGECGVRSAAGGGHAPRSTLHAPNLLCLPYQPLDQLAGSLSAADLHVVVMGPPFLGLIHPCKIYNVLSVAAPVLYIGPQPSHVTDIFETGHVPPNGSPHPHPSLPPYARAAHGDVEAVLKAIARIRQDASPSRSPVPAGLGAHFSEHAVLPKLIAELESA
jgi:colanic acid biosynthesis glycosyl transferase WcaI